MQRKTTKQLINYNQAYEYALKRLSYRDYSEYGLKKLLLQHYCPEEIANEVSAKLKEYSFLDDARYAERVYSAWLAKKYYGMNHLRLELQKKNVKEEFAARIIASFSDEMQLERAIKAAKKWQEKNNKMYELEKRDYLAKLARFLMVRGFNGNIIKMALNRLGCDFAE